MILTDATEPAILFIIISTLKVYAQPDAPLKRFAKAELETDFDIAVNSLKEAHPGLYWYTSYIEFENLCRTQRLKIVNNLTALDFYRILAPVVVATKEGHCKISLSDEIDRYFNSNGNYPPLFIKFFGDKPYIINDVDGLEIKGNILSKIKGRPITEITERMFATIPSDGYNLTKKYRTIDCQDFSYYYSDVYDQSKSCTLEVIDPDTDRKIIHTVSSVSGDWLEKKWNSIKGDDPKSRAASSSLSFFNTNKTAVLAYNTFKSEKYDDFHKVTDGYFKQILIIQ